MKANKNSMLGFAAAAAIVAMAMPAYAADVVYEQPPAPPAAPMEVAPVATWAGPYAGIALGYGFAGEVSADGGPDIDTDGFVGNVFGGWQGQSDRFVYGVEGDIGYNGMKGDEGGVDVEHGVDGSIRARLGYAATDNVLLYATGGGAASRLEASAPGISESETALGWTAGAGVDVKLTPKSFARLEYRYTDLSADFDGGDVDTTSNRVLLGVGMQF
ncbi:outer membrane beta-barrel protein [Chelativorans sp. AA-79]|uniref:outer membrane protein n=1 Tax=Chelativorans sp. AA-79 TaxID=3028735 RepID=UPI0023F91E2A|nr:outer membrane beta-barrel protein [Chelativorans sp. AA-79]WEX11930.1 outer membrane beta-barrel protein [Chelativorans sp. AA-79]